MKMILLVALGGALGAVARYGFLTLFTGIAAWGTLVVNVLGSFIMGAFIELTALYWSPPMEVKAFIAVGLLGAFTTFSTFSMDVVLLFQRGEYYQVFFYVLGSVILSVTAFFLGFLLIKNIF